jgi:heptosyltransferase-1
VIACRLRDWRRRPLAALRSGEWRAFRAELGAERYDLVIDAQGLLKSAWLARHARGPLAGPDRASVREPIAALFYRDRYPVPRFDVAHAVERNRRLFAQALGYALPDLAAPPDSGLRREQFAAPAFDRPYAMFLHGTTWTSKRWPRAHWQALAEQVNARGLHLVLPWGNTEEKLEAESIAEGRRALVLPKLGLTALTGWLSHARACVGVDTGLMHLAAALATPGISLYGPTLPALTGAVGRNQVWLRDDESATTIDRERALMMPPGRVIAALDNLLA